MFIGCAATCRAIAGSSLKDSLAHPHQKVETDEGSQRRFEYQTIIF